VLQVSGWQERAPRSISRDYDAFNSNLVIPVGDPGSEQKSHDDKVTSRTGATDTNIAQNSYNNVVVASRTSKPAGTRLSDVFISVKTTRNYHKWRLPVILKTWFQLAKDQVRIITLLISCFNREYPVTCRSCIRYLTPQSSCLLSSCVVYFTTLSAHIYDRVTE